MYKTKSPPTQIEKKELFLHISAVKNKIRVEKNVT